MPKLQLYYPCKPYGLFQGFGQCAPPSVCKIYKDLGLAGHNGLDLLAPTGTVVRAAHDGVVTFSGDDGSAGLGIVIRTEEKFEYKGNLTYLKSVYWHLKTGCLYVKAGQHVKTGDIIALSDNTGLSTGPHLHFGLKPVYQGEQDWQWLNTEQGNGFKGAIDPEIYFTGQYAEDVKQKRLSDRIEEVVIRLGVDADASVLKAFAILLRTIGL